jgi:hypothetical protein
LFFRRYFESVSKSPVFLHRAETGETFRFRGILNHIGKRDRPLVKAPEKLRCAGAIAAHSQERNLEEIFPTRLPKPELNVTRRFWYWTGKALVYKGTKLLKRRTEAWMSLEKCLSFRRFTELEGTIHRPLSAACGAKAPKQEYSKPDKEAATYGGYLLR